MILIIAAVAIGAGAYIATRPQAEFHVKDLTVDQVKVGKGQSVTARVKIVNVGDAKGTHTVKLKLGREVYTTREVTLEAGESKIFSFEVEKKELGSYTLNLEDLSKTFEVVKPAEFEVRDLDVIPSKVAKGENVEVKAKIANVGDIQGTRSVTLKVEGEPFTRKELTLDLGEVKTLSFDITKQEKGKYDLSIGDLSRTLIVVNPAKFEVSNLKISPSEAQIEVEFFETITYDDFSSSQLADSLSLGERATHEVSNSRINLTNVPKGTVGGSAHGSVIDSSFDGSWRNWKWEGNVVNGSGRVTLHFYSGLGWLDGQGGGGYEIAFREFVDEIGIRWNGDSWLTSVNYSFRPGEQHKYKVIYREGDIEVFVDSKRELSYTIVSPNYTYDGFGVRGYSGTRYLLDYRLSRITSGVEQGEPVNISVDVSNTGGLPGDYTVKLMINGTIEDSRTVTLDGGETTTVSFTVQRGTSGTYLVELGGLTSSFEVIQPTFYFEGFKDGTLGDFVDDSGNFRVIYVGPSPEPKYRTAGEMVTYEERKVIAHANPIELSGGKQIDSFEYYWYELPESWGGGIKLLDKNGEMVMGSASSNPGWDLHDGDGLSRIYGPGEGYNRWIHFKFTFNWNAGTYDYHMEDLKTGHVETGTRNLARVTNVETISIQNYNGLVYGWGPRPTHGYSPFYMFFDNIQFTYL